MIRLFFFLALWWLIGVGTVWPQDSTKPALQQPAPRVASDSAAISAPSVARPAKAESTKAGAARPAWRDWFSIEIDPLSALIALLTLIVALYPLLPKPLFNKDERRYRKALRKELGQIKLVGPGMDDISVRLDDTFVHLRISGDGYRVGEHPSLGAPERQVQSADGFSPDELMEKAFVELKRPLLLVIGDPGSGKTTLLKYYTVKCLSKKGHKKIGFKKAVLPIFLPLREVNVEKPIGENLRQWCEKHALSIKSESFDKWLQAKRTLLLLDGLDEVRDAELRQKMCAWIDNTCNGLANAHVIVTSRPTGYRGRDKVVLQSDLLQADIRDFTQTQREEFLQKWFTAACLRETHLRPPDEPVREWKKAQKHIAEVKSKSLLVFLAQPQNKSLRELSGIPMLLQIMAILWKKDEHLPKNRSKLYGIALDYLLDYRDAQRQLEPLLSADDAQRVLSPACLWMQEEWQHEEVPKNKLHERMQNTLRNIPKAPRPEAFCENLRDRAGILADNTKNEYIFRHKSFREFFAGLELAKSYNKKGRLQRLAAGFFDDWWEEPLRFFISKADGEAFNGFMAALFSTPESREMNANLLTRLITLVEEAREPEVSALANTLQNPATQPPQHFAVLECLKTIGTPVALQAVESFIRKPKAAKESRERARQIIRETEGTSIALRAERMESPFSTLVKTFHNPVEYNAEYILIRGGTIKYSATKQIEKVPDIYFAKYPVTNKQYRRFMRYLMGEETEMGKLVSAKIFAEKFLEFAATDQAYAEYLGRDAKAWPETLKSKYDEDRKFNGEDQPVVGVSWYAARAYCFWLSLCENGHVETFRRNVSTPNVSTPDASTPNVSTIYRLPKETEWERAAAGRREDGVPRKYPWPTEKGEPNEKLANYGRNVGQTTPVGRYPEGATPEGLMDMAGNVWEWQENWYSEKKDARGLRGGSWFNGTFDLPCAIRIRNDPQYSDVDVGFRVVRAQS